LFRFELTSFIGRLFTPRRRRDPQPRLHVGSGANVFEGFENLDFYALPRFWTMTWLGQDLRFPLPYADASFEGAFTEHTLEHLYPGQAIVLMKEMRRVLRSGAVLRVVVPDLGAYVRFYNGEKPDPAFDKFGSGCEAIWSLTQNWGHLSCWDAAMLQQQLLAAGFKEARLCAYGQGSRPELLRDQAERRWESLYVEAIA
jgi:SAM-dependent methyltransferase